MTDISQLEAYRELEETEKYWRTIFDSSSEAMAVFTADGHHLDVNPAWEKLTGYSKQEALSAAFSVEQILDAETVAALKSPESSPIKPLKQARISSCLII